MKTLNKPNGFVARHIGLQKAKKCNYRLSEYLVRDGNAIYNALTGEAVLVEDWKTEKAVLMQRWFLVPEDMDMAELSLSLRKAARLLNGGPGANNKNSYVIFTTTGCNASCGYCFERGVKIERMSDEIAMDTAKYIEKHSSGKDVRIKWFGGEPLCNWKAISTICGYLAERGISIRSNMSTNGDLLPEIPDAELKLWNLRDAQFTLDDIGSGYDNIKGLPAGAYDRLKETVRRFGRLGIKATLRIHLHPDKGIGPCKKIVDEFSSEKNATMYGRILYDAPNIETYDLLLELEDYIGEKRGTKPGFPKINHANHCMADNRRIACVTPIGNLSPCEHYTDKHLYGSIYSDDIDSDSLAKWTKMIKDGVRECRLCNLYPSCRKIVMCPAEGKCEDGYAYYQIEKIKRAMRARI